MRLGQIRHLAFAKYHQQIPWNARVMKVVDNTHTANLFLAFACPAQPPYTTCAGTLVRPHVDGAPDKRPAIDYPMRPTTLRICGKTRASPRWFACGPS